MAGSREPPRQEMEADTLTAPSHNSGFDIDGPTTLDTSLPHLDIKLSQRKAVPGVNSEVFPGNFGAEDYPSPVTATTYDGTGSTEGEGLEGVGSPAKDGLGSFFQPGDEESNKDNSWRNAKHGSTLAKLLSRVEELGNVDMAMSEESRFQEEEQRKEAIVRAKVMTRFVRVMGPHGPGLLVKKYHRAGGNRSERGKWAARTIRFDSAGARFLRDGTPIGGSITWNSKRLFAREQCGVDVEEIDKAENSGKFVWVKTQADAKLGFETQHADDARFLCRAINFLIDALATYDEDDDVQNPLEKELTEFRRVNTAPMSDSSSHDMRARRNPFSVHP